MFVCIYCTVSGSLDNNIQFEILDLRDAIQLIQDLISQTFSSPLELKYRWYGHVTKSQNSYKSTFAVLSIFPGFMIRNIRKTVITLCRCIMWWYFWMLLLDMVKCSSWKIWGYDQKRNPLLYRKTSWLPHMGSIELQLLQIGPTKTAPLLNKYYWNEGSLNGDEIP